MDKKNKNSVSYDLIMKMSESVRNHPLASKLIKMCRKEVTLKFKWPETDTMCKSRLDGISVVDPGFIIEIKTSKSARKNDFEREARRLNYFGQQVFYTNAAAQNNYRIKQ